MEVILLSAQREPIAEFQKGEEQMVSLRLRVREDKCVNDQNKNH